MTFKEILEKIESSKVFKEFKTNFPNAELCAGFFVIDISNDTITKTLDYLAREKVFTFSVNEDSYDNEGNEVKDVTMQEDKLQEPTESMNRPKLSKILPSTTIEPEELKGIAGIEAFDNGIRSRFQKIIAVLQNYKGEESNDEQIQVWNLTCILEDLIIIHMLIDLNSKKVIKFERKNLMDWMRRID